MTIEERAQQQAWEIAGTCACFNLRKASRVVTRLYDEALQPVGILGTQLPLLVGLRALGPATVQALAEMLVIDRTTLSRSLGPLERDGLVRVEPGEDRRERLLALTTKGRRRLERAVPLWKKAQRRIVRALGQDRYARLLKDLGQLVRSTEADSLG